MLKKKSPSSKVSRLEKQLAKYQKQHNELRQQSPDRWWHNEHFDNQLKVLESIIEETKKELIELRKKQEEKTKTKV